MLTLTLHPRIDEIVTRSDGKGVLCGLFLPRPLLSQARNFAIVFMHVSISS
jgi:hypothetical protein